MHEGAAQRTSSCFVCKTVPPMDRATDRMICTGGRRRGGVRVILILKRGKSKKERIKCMHITSRHKSDFWSFFIGGMDSSRRCPEMFPCRAFIFRKVMNEFTNESKSEKTHKIIRSDSYRREFRKCFYRIFMEHQLFNQEELRNLAH